MKLRLTSPKQSLSLALRRQRPKRSDLDQFKVNLKGLLDKTDNEESEEHQKNNVRDFLNDTWYKASNYINTKGREDMAIHLGKTNKDKVGVIIETKTTANINEMPVKDKPNCKALQQLVLYYMRERVDENNIDLKYLAITNIKQWYIFEAAWFEKHFYRNAKFKKEYEEWRDDKKVTHDTPLFYKEIAKPFIDKIDEEVTCTFFDLDDYDKALEGKDDKGLIALYKILSPNHLLKASFEDSNKLNEKFYKELLHIIGLEEAKDGGKYIIRRKAAGRNPGSLLENAIAQLEANNIALSSQYGGNKEEKQFNTALELCITWINRVLFLKLLEAQLVNYHNGDKDYRFLDTKTIPDYGELFKLFHSVLAVDINKRNDQLKKKYSRVPYLNSSLFEISELEGIALKVNQLDHAAELEFISTTILKEDLARVKRTGSGRTGSASLPALEYLLKFLKAYDFASEGSEDVEEENKDLINASVLGKVFEKINGYKDGSFFTPGFITMYMCRKSIRLAILEKFKNKYSWKFEDFDELKNPIKDDRSKKKILEYNALINSLHICDPAVGSGHFLVSALNEIIAIKSELGILADKEGLRLDCHIKIENDELNILLEKSGEEDFFEYKVTNGNVPESLQKIQKTIFHEKQTIIENCLFGVDVNPNSVKICRLRLWIELLKNAYYKEESNYTNLETLPNIDINIKCGNSLISRFPIDADLSKVLKSVKYNIETYRGYVNEYKNAKDREFKKGLEKLIEDIKTNFRSEINSNDPKIKRLQKLQYEFNLLVAPHIFKEEEADYGNKNYKKDKNERTKKLEDEINKLSKEIEEIKNNAIYRNALEWRFEFPEVLNDNGDFEGFDLVIGNPPYGVNFSLSEKLFLKDRYFSTDDIFTAFIEKGIKLSKDSSFVSFITPVFWLTGDKYIATRRLISEQANLYIGITLPYDIFTDAYVDTGIYIFSKTKNTKSSYVYEFLPREKVDFSVLNSINLNELSKDSWSLTNDLKIIFNPISRLLSSRLNKFETKVEDITDSIRGILAAPSDYSSTMESGYEPVFVGKIDRFFIEKDNFKFIKYGDNLREKPSSFTYFTGERILIRRIVNRQFRIMATISDEKFVTKKDVYTFKVNQNKFSSKYLLAIINSKLVSFLKTRGSVSAKKDDFTQLTLNDIRQLRIPKPTKEQATKIESLVSQIIVSVDEQTQYVKLDKEIDQMVYKLYDLTDEEIAIIEKESK